MSIFFKMQQDDDGKKKVVDFLSREYGGVGLNVLEFIPESSILCGCEPTDKERLIEMLASRIARLEKPETENAIREAVMDRESLGSTVVEGGVAFPHARTEDVSALHIAVAVCEEGFDFLDEGKVNVVFLLVSNDEYASLYLLALAALAKVVQDRDKVSQLAGASEPSQVRKILDSSPLRMKAKMTVEEVMKWPEIVLDPERSLQKVSYALEEARIDCAFVVDEKGVLMGEINDLDLLRVTAADVFSGEHERILLAKDAMQRKVPTLSPEHSVAQAAMQMVDQRRNRLPVVDTTGKLLGEVVWNDLIGKMLTK